jgi:hypothetical protein
LSWGKYGDDDLELILELFNNACHPECLEHCRQQLNRAQEMATAFAANKQ